VDLASASGRDRESEPQVGAPRGAALNSTALAARNILPFSPDNIEIVHGMWTGGERSFPSLDPGLNFDDPFGLSPWAWIVRGTVWIARHGRAVGAAVGIGGRGISVAKEARRIPDSPQMNQLRDAAAKSQQLTVEIRGKTISFEPELPYEGMTNAGRGFHLG
jgi:hypothetical protein